MKTRVIVLAAGHGKRMNLKAPKVLAKINGEPLITHLINSIKDSGVDEKPVIIIGQHGGAIKNALGDEHEYVLQEKQLGTGHAVGCAEGVLSGKTDGVIVLYGDHPFVKASTIIKLKELCENGGSPLAMMTTKVENFDDWRSIFYGFGRITRDLEGNIKAIVERKDATEKELDIKEVNPAYYCFNSGWLWENIKKIKNNNAAHEYYLTDLIQIAIEDGERIASICINPSEAIGVNTQKDFVRAKELL